MKFEVKIKLLRVEFIKLKETASVDACSRGFPEIQKVPHFKCPHLRFKRPRLKHV